MIGDLGQRAAVRGDDPHVGVVIAVELMTGAIGDEGDARRIGRPVRIEIVPVVAVSDLPRSAGFRVSGDWRPEKIGYKIREAQAHKVPYMFVVGKAEAADASVNSVSARHRFAGDLGSKTSLEQWITKIARLAAERAVDEGERPETPPKGDEPMASGGVR